MKKSLNYDKFFEWWSDGRSFLSESHAIAIYNSLPPDQSAEVERLRGLLVEAVAALKEIEDDHCSLRTDWPELVQRMQEKAHHALAKLKADQAIDTKGEIKRG